MSDEQIICPSCSHRLRVPAELLGQPVECPQCHYRFTAPVPGGAAPPVRPFPGDVGDDFGPAYADDLGARSHRGRALLTPPGVALLVVGILSVLSGGYVAFTGVAARSNPEMFEQQFRAEIDKNRDLTPQQREQLEQWFAAENYAKYALLFGGVSAAAALLMVGGAIAMLTRKMYWLAVLGSIAALNPTNIGCCCLNVPFGIWALIVLMNANAKAAFR